MLKLMRWILILASGPVFAYEPAPSPERIAGQDWAEALAVAFEERGLAVAPGSALQPYTSEIYAGRAIPRWPGAQEDLRRLFLIARDARPHENPNPGAFRRKAPWLYPHDGCYSKAAHVSYIADREGYPRPGKIYAFGNLRLRTPYAKNGKTAYWSYHVAAAYLVGSTVYVLDPAVSAAAPLTRAEWLARISAAPAKVRVSLCDSHSYSPASPCRGGKGNGAYLGHARRFLRLEWSGLKRLGYSPAELLGP